MARLVISSPYMQLDTAPFLSDYHSTQRTWYYNTEGPIQSQAKFVTMGGGGSKADEAASTGASTSSGPIGHWNLAREEWWTSVSSSYKNIMTVGDALTTCYSLLELS